MRKSAQLAGSKWVHISSPHLWMEVHVAVVDERLEDGSGALDVDALFSSLGRVSPGQSRKESLGGGGGSAEGSLV